MKIVVCGSRSFLDQEKVNKVLNQITVSEVVTGGAQGADGLAAEWAEKNGRINTIIHADWELHGRSAGYIRNFELMKTKPDLVVAFWDGVSRGTRHTISLAHEQKVPTLIVYKKE